MEAHFRCCERASSLAVTHNACVLHYTANGRPRCRTVTCC